MAKKTNHIEMYKMKRKFFFSFTLDPIPKDNYYHFFSQFFQKVYTDKSIKMDTL